MPKPTTPPMKIALIVQGGVVQAAVYQQDGSKALIPIEVEVIDYDVPDAGDAAQSVLIAQSSGEDVPASAYRVPSHFAPAQVRDAFTRIHKARERQSQASGGETATDTIGWARPTGGTADPVGVRADGCFVDPDTGEIIGHEDETTRLDERAEVNAEADAYFDALADGQVA